MKKLVSIFAIVLGALAISSTNALAHLTASDLELLRGLDGFQLMVERIKPEIERDGLFRSTLREDMELRLRIGGVKVLSEEEAENKPDAPVLYLHVDALKSSVGYAYNIRLSLREPVNLVRTNVKVSATILRIFDELAITSSLSDIRDAAGECRRGVHQTLEGDQSKEIGAFTIHVFPAAQRSLIGHITGERRPSSTFKPRKSNYRLMIGFAFFVHERRSVMGEFLFGVGVDGCRSSGSSIDRVVSTFVFMTDLADFQEMNKVYAEYLSPILLAGQRLR